MIGRWISQFFSKMFVAIRDELHWHNIKKTFVYALIGMLIFRFMMASNVGRDDFEIYFWGFILGIFGSYLMRIIAHVILNYLLDRPEVIFERTRANTKNKP